MTEEQVKYLMNPENAFKCADCPENEHDDKRKMPGRLPCNQWQCWVVLRTETWRKKGRNDQRRSD